MEISDVTCNYLHQPLGVETSQPRLSWALSSQERAAVQSAYQILAATSEDSLIHDLGDLWDTGKVESRQSLHIVYGGNPLVSRQPVFWKVRVWDGHDEASPWSSIESFEMGILTPEGWQGRWIGHPRGRTERDHAVPAPYFRKKIFLPSEVVRGRVYISGLGFNELIVNGNKVGDAVLAPGFTRYDQTVLYQTFDITQALRRGENVFAVVLGNGWYNTFTDDVWDFRQAAWRDQPKLLLQAHILLANGAEYVVTSGPDWKTAASPIGFDGLRNGEFYDARQEITGWAQASYDDSEWTAAKIVRSPGGQLRSEQMPPIKVVDTIHPIAMREVDPETWVFDLGQNISGWAQIRIRASAGTQITLKYAEDIDSKGRLDTAQIDCFVKSGEFQTDKYIAKGGGEEVWEPRFVYHGFRYVQVTGLSGPPTLDTVHGRVVHTALESRGGFECANPLLNRIQKAARWSTLTNYHSIPTDCPHREKNGWTGDAALSAEQVLLNFDPTTAYIKWMRDIQDAQRPSGQIPGIVPTAGWGYNWGSGPAWDSALFLIPWYVYQYEGDPVLLEQMYSSMQAYLNYAVSMSEEYVVDFGLGDWCPPTGGEGGHQCPTVVTDTAYFYVMADVMAKAAAILGRFEDGERYGALAQTIRNAFRQRFLDSGSGRVTGECQTSQACALYQGLVDPDERERVLQRLVDDVEAKGFHLDAGILGAKYEMHVLTDFGRADLAYAMATKTTFPSWGHWLEQGATTLWEQWDGKGSHNHHMFSDVSAWFYQGLAGITADIHDPGYRHIVFRPSFVPGLGWVKAWHQSAYGRIRCDWETDGRTCHIAVEVPPNCHATLVMPQGYTINAQEAGNVLADMTVNQTQDQLSLEFGSGVYKFQGERAGGRDPGEPALPKN